MKNIKDVLEKQKIIYALIISYEKDYGSCTKVILSTGESLLLKHTIHSTLRHLGDSYALDLKILRRKYCNILNCKYYVPLPFDQNHLFVPIKTQKPIVHKDPSVSYINYYAIEKLSTKEPVLYLKNNTKVKSLNTVKTIKKRIHHARICAKFDTLKKHPTATVAERPGVYHTQNSKEELAQILEEISNIRDLILENLSKKEKR
ncbi:hypothetical protein RH915_10615 [Serpentinicella sp. ANB-PHB4]|uniref:hypothetical protein n=1 Tax=Serpentinicella sp. ANB-PHB4 TaxID=3074076 RepID=UPI00285F69A0|nr:hypothetical protein [Serpentinicella sp. ANB-PHB4]MDR5659941.1 hypothetical protein [Serpentinicella sp. ANB-PHB4]